MNMRKCKIFFTSDVHGYFYPTSYGDMLEKNMGLFQCAAQFQKDANSLMIDGGDNLQGSAFAYYCRNVLRSNKHISDIMNDLGYDYYTLGNHDFNYGQEYQKEYIENMKAKCVCQNVTDEQGNVRHPYEICQLENGLKIGIVGIVTEFVNVWEKKENLVGVAVTDPFEAAKSALNEMKDKVDITLCIYHGGFECDVNTGEVKSTSKENVGYKICKELDFDILLTGHQHMSLNGKELFGTYIVQPLDQAKEFHQLIVSVAEDGTIGVESEKIAADASKGYEMRKKYLAVEEDVQEWLNQPIGHLKEALIPDEKIKMALYGTKIADFINKIQLHFSDAQISTVGLANDIAGFRKDVSTRDVIATYPYPNTLVVLKITGKQLKQAMERSAEYFEMQEDGSVTVSKSFLDPKVEHYNYDYYAGVQYEIHPEMEKGNRIHHLRYQGKEVAPEQEFTLCMNNYRASGAGGYPMYTQCPIVQEINIEMVELIMEYFHQFPLIEDVSCS